MGRDRAFTPALIALICGALIVVPGCEPAAVDAPDDALPVRLGVSQENLSAFAYVARDEGIFEECGLDVDFIEYTSSQLAHQQLLNGEVDAALCADTPIVIAALEGRPVRIIATVASDTNDIKVVARSDAGIAQPADLAGKRIGTRRGTAAHFFLHSFLINNGMSESDVDMRFDSFEGARDALIAGDLDAVSARQPFISELENALGDRFVLFEEQGLYGKTMNLCLAPGAEPDFEVQVRLVRAFVEAERRALERDPEPMKARIAADVGIGVDDLCDCLFIEGAVGLRQSLVLTLEDQARWALSSGLADSEDPLDALALIDTAPLDEIDPDRVSILR